LDVAAARRISAGRYFVCVLGAAAPKLFRVTRINVGQHWCLVAIESKLLLQIGIVADLHISKEAQPESM